MSLKPCRECGKEISTSAKKCPHCGVDKPGEMNVQTILRTLANALMGIGLVLTIIMVLIMML